MTYETALEKIHSLLTFGSRPGLDRMRTLLKRLGDPQDRLKYIHVAGTNGKGSVCAMISSVLCCARYKTGLFISPYITDFRERIQINGEMISKEALAEAVERTFPLIEQLRSEGVIITEFEYVNALAFLIFAETECDVVVLETGLGGLLDCTNVIKPPLCSVITTIGLDHTAILGDTIEEIAAQKCGIIKSGSAVISSAQDSRAMEVIEKTAKACGVPLMTSGEVDFDVHHELLGGTEFEYGLCFIRLKLIGEHQIENCKTAVRALEYLRTNDILSFTDSQLSLGLCLARNPARLEVMNSEPLVLLDGAHNPNGIEALKKAVDRYMSFKPRKLCIIGMLADKDVDGSIKLLNGVFDKVYCVPVNNPRALSPEALAEKFSGHSPVVRAFDSAEQAFDEAFAEAESTKDCGIIICGSLYLAGEIRPFLLKRSEL